MGDLVLVADEDTPRAEWPMGKVCQVYPDKSGWVRQADVKFASKCLRRRISKLCFLESTK